MPDDVDPLVFVPGLGCTEQVFAAQVAALGADRQILVADQRRDPTIPAMARSVLDQAPARFGLAGHSMGGYVALEVLRQAPERVSRLALLNTGARADPPEARDRREELIALARSGRLAEVNEILWPRLVHRDRSGDRSLRETVDAMLQETGVEAFIRQQRAIMGRADQRELLSQAAKPTLVLVGDADAITPVELSREMAGLLEEPTLVILPRCGHMAPIERPERVTHALRTWLAG